MNRDDLAKAIEAAIERFHDACPQGQGDPGDGGVAGRALCQLFYDHSDIILAALRTPDGDDGIIMRAGRCGHHFAEDCEGCQAARDVTNYELDRLRAALSASRPVGEGWRPIETAPRDGTEIITYWRCDGKTEVSADTYWWERGDQWISHGDGSINPVAWQPLPEPPRSHAEDSSE